MRGARRQAGIERLLAEAEREVALAAMNNNTDDLLAALKKIADGTPNVTSAAPDSDDQKNPGTKPEQGQKESFFPPEDYWQD